MTNYTQVYLAIIPRYNVRLYLGIMCDYTTHFIPRYMEVLYNLPLFGLFWKYMSRRGGKDKGNDDDTNRAGVF